MTAMHVRRWLPLSLVVALLFGAWGALIEIPEKRFEPGFPATLGYIVWSVTMLPCAAAALARARWRLDRSGRAVRYGALVGILGSAGQLAVFRALQSGPAYLVFPIVSLAPAVTVLLSIGLLRERTNAIAGWGVGLSLPAVLLLALQPPASPDTHLAGGWLIGALGGMAMWGTQGYLIKSSTGALSAESLFAYMALAAVALAPIAWTLTDPVQTVSWGAAAALASTAIQLLNSIGALFFIYAVRAGKAMLVAPTINGLYPAIAILLSLAIYRRTPDPWNVIGMVLALTAVVLMTYGEGLAEADPNAEALQGPCRGGGAQRRSVSGV